MLLADIALPVPLAHAFTYTLPPELKDRVIPGARVVVPFGNRRAVGIVVDVKEGDPPEKAKPVLDALDEAPALPPDLLAFLRDVSAYYLAPIGEVIKLALPPEDRAAAKAKAKPSLFDAKKGLSARQVQWVCPEPNPTVGLDKPLSGQANAILQFVRANGEAPIAKLEAQWKSARAAVKKLASLGLVRLEGRDAARDPFFQDAIERDSPPQATEPQAAAMDAIAQSIQGGEAGTFLLHGVTGSGKTEVYLAAIDTALAQKKGAIVLVPEIALTPQLVSRYRARFGDDVAVVHSALTPRERFDTWMRLRRGELDVVMGARSALFTPVQNLGLVIVDEEHDPSFKQEEGVRYHARDMAILRAHRAKGTCVLGSATPSLESEHLARTDKAKKLFLPERARGQAMPTVEVVDLRRIGAGPTGDKRLSIPLHRAIEKTLAAKQQTILFLNRRGFSPSVRCEACGEMMSCPSCSVALTFHKRFKKNAPPPDPNVRTRPEGTLRCHYCDFAAALPDECTKCKQDALALEGLGTEKLEETLQNAFPTARIARLDRDVATGKNIEKIIAKVRDREVDILVGTQMVTKGHDLPHVTLVGVINADAALSIPDFRAAERTFHLLVQVAGRAGRGDTAGKVLVQTYDPQHPAISYATKHDVLGFLERELMDRKELQYPPYTRAALVRVDAIDEAEARETATRLAQIARDAAAKETCGVHILGPAPAPLARLRARYRFRIMLRCEERLPLRRVLLAVERSRHSFPRSVRTGIDVDPVQLL
ncbi:MAG TPA: primosomal protein N' [Polyangiaceae bacterium]